MTAPASGGMKEIMENRTFEKAAISG